MNLTGKKAIVTGVSKGIGKALVEQLLEKGTTVAGWGRNAPDIKHENFSFYSADIQDHKQVEKVAQSTLKDLGTVDALVNNAGLGYFRNMELLSTNEWLEMFNTNVHGLFYCSRAVLPGMRAQKSGHIVNIASVAGLMGLEEGSGYCGTKFAVRGISEALFKEVRKDGIKVSCLYPGSVNTDFFDHYDGVVANDTFMTATEVAATVIQVLETSDNFITLNVEMRPLNAKPRP